MVRLGFTLSLLPPCRGLGVPLAVLGALHTLGVILESEVNWSLSLAFAGEAHSQSYEATCLSTFYFPFWGDTGCCVTYPWVPVTGSFL